MDSFFLLITGEATVGLYVVLTMIRGYRSHRTTICPDTAQTVEMEITAVHGSTTTALGKTDLRVKWCSLWPARKGCAEDCLIGDWHPPKEQTPNDIDDGKLAAANK